VIPLADQYAITGKLRGIRNLEASLSATRPVFTRAYTKSILVKIFGNGKCVLTSDRHRTRGSTVVAEAQRYSKRMVCVLYRSL
jgi:hypothetical protein